MSERSYKTARKLPFIPPPAAVTLVEILNIYSDYKGLVMLSREQCKEIVEAGLLNFQDAATLDCRINQLTLHGGQVTLTLSEPQKRLLVCLFTGINCKRQIINIVWYEYHQRIGDNNYHQLVFQLRALLKQHQLSPKLVMTVPYYGLKINEPMLLALKPGNAGNSAPTEAAVPPAVAAATAPSALPGIATIAGVHPPVTAPVSAAVPAAAATPVAAEVAGVTSPAVAAEAADVTRQPIAAEAADVTPPPIAAEATGTAGTAITSSVASASPSAVASASFNAATVATPGPSTSGGQPRSQRHAGPSLIDRLKNTGRSCFGFCLLVLV